MWNKLIRKSVLTCCVSGMKPKIQKIHSSECIFQDHTWQTKVKQRKLITQNVRTAKKLCHHYFVLCCASFHYHCNFTGTFFKLLPQLDCDSLTSTTYRRKIILSIFGHHCLCVHYYCEIFSYSWPRIKCKRKNRPRKNGKPNTNVLLSREKGTNTKGLAD